MLARQRLEIVANGKVVAREAFAPGDYKLPVRLPQSLWNETVDLTIKARSAYQPSSIDRNADRRKLCYLLRGIGYVERFADAAPA
jgi:hypothetical protein